MHTLPIVSLFLWPLTFSQPSAPLAARQENELSVRVVPLQHTSAEELQVTVGALLGKYELVVAEPRTNSLLLKAYEDRLDSILEIITALDQPVVAVNAAPPAAAPAVSSGLFLPVTRDLIFELDSSGKGPTLGAVLRQYERVTGQVLVAGESTREMLEQTNAGMTVGVTVPAESAQSFVEQLLVARGCFLLPCPATTPLVVEVFTSRGNESQKIFTRSYSVAAADIEAWSAIHPAVPVQVSISLQSDVRQLANALRTLLNDPAVCQLIPAGTTNVIVVVGSSQAVASLVRLLQLIDQASVSDLQAINPAPAQ